MDSDLVCTITIQTMKLVGDAQQQATEKDDAVHGFVQKL